MQLAAHAAIQLDASGVKDTLEICKKGKLRASRLVLRLGTSRRSGDSPRPSAALRQSSFASHPVEFK